MGYAFINFIDKIYIVNFFIQFNKPSTPTKLFSDKNDALKWLEEHIDILYNHLRNIKPDCIIISVPKLTRGAVETALASEEYINNDDPLIITNSDQIFEWDKDKYIEYLNKTRTDADVVVTGYLNNRSEGIACA